MSRALRLTLIALVILVAHLGAPAAYAHPLGNFSVNQYAGLQLALGQLRVDYVLDMAEIPAFQEIAALDRDGDGRAGEAELGDYPARQCESIRQSLDLRLDGRAQPLRAVEANLEFPPGQSGLLTLRLSCAFTAAIDLGEQMQRLEFANNAFAGRQGWREIVVAAEGLRIEGDYAVHSPSARLAAYPQDLLTSPPDQRQLSLQVASLGIAGAEPAHSPAATAAAPPETRDDAFTRLALLDELTPLTLLAALAIAFAWGALHALTPGHGKTIVAAYLVGSRGTAWHALYLGLTTTITHTAGVFALGLVTLFASRYILPEQLFPWLNLISGLLVLGIGAGLLIQRLRRGVRFPTPAMVMAGDDHGHAHDHSHAHPHPHPHTRQASAGHEHTHPGPAYQEHPHGSEEHHHHHDHAGHSHLPPGADGAPVTWRSLLALGVSGGLLPCPSALVVLLSAIALGRTGLGIALVIAFSLGLAGLLTAIGVAFVFAGRYFERFSLESPLRNGLLRWLPAASALIIALLGLGIASRALLDAGILALWDLP